MSDQLSVLYILLIECRQDVAKSWLTYRLTVYDEVFYKCILRSYLFIHGGIELEGQLLKFYMSM